MLSFFAGHDSSASLIRARTGDGIRGVKAAGASRKSMVLYHRNNLLFRLGLKRSQVINCTGLDPAAEPAIIASDLRATSVESGSTDHRLRRSRRLEPPSELGEVEAAIFRQTVASVGTRSLRGSGHGAFVRLVPTSWR